MPMYEFECLACGECGHFIGSYEDRAKFGCPGCAEEQRMQPKLENGISTGKN